MTWRDRLEQQPEWRDFGRWPHVDPASLSAAARKNFHRNREIVARVLAGQSMTSIAQYFRVSGNTLTRLLNRCLGGTADKSPALNRGLIPGLRLVSSHRHKALGRLDVPAGAAHAFKHLLATVPGLEAHLEKRLKKAKTPSRTGENQTPKAFHSAFIRYLKGLNWPEDTYPFTVTSRGYETLRTYLRQRLTAQHMPKASTRIILSATVTCRYCEEVQIDEYTVDCHGAVTLELNRDLVPLRMARIHLLTARDVATGNILAYTFSLSHAPTAEDMLDLLGQLVTPWQPMALSTPGLAYPPDGCIPTALSESFPRVMIGIIRLDNAWMHLALTIRHYVCTVLGATLNLGLIKYPEGRHVIEHAFAKLNVDLHRLPSTTGSHPHAEIREPDTHKKKAPVISLRALEEIISVLYVAHNIRTLGNLGGASPLATAEHQMAHRLLPLRPPYCDDSLNPFSDTCVVVIRQNKGHQPHIHFEGTRYKGRGICEADYINQQVTIRFNRQDLRELEVTTRDGLALGSVLAPKTWQRFAHGMTTRKYINQLVRQNFIERDDPLGGYFDFLLNHRHLPTQAKELIRVSREFSQTTILTPDAQPNEKPDSQSHHHLSNEAKQKKALKEIPSWHPGMVNERK